MEFDQKKKYKIQVNVLDRVLTYNECTILNENGMWLVFSDKFNKIFSYNKNNIVSLEEIGTQLNLQEVKK